MEFEAVFVVTTQLVPPLIEDVPGRRYTEKAPNAPGRCLIILGCVMFCAFLGMPGLRRFPSCVTTEMRHVSARFAHGGRIRDSSTFGMAHGCSSGELTSERYGLLLRLVGFGCACSGCLRRSLRGAEPLAAPPCKTWCGTSKASLAIGSMYKATVDATVLDDSYTRPRVLRGYYGGTTGPGVFKHLIYHVHHMHDQPSADNSLPDPRLPAHDSPDPLCPVVDRRTIDERRTIVR